LLAKYFRAERNDSWKFVCVRRLLACKITSGVAYIIIIIIIIIIMMIIIIIIIIIINNIFHDFSSLRSEESYACDLRLRLCFFFLQNI